MCIKNNSLNKKMISYAFWAKTCARFADDHCITYRERRVRYETRRTGNFKNARGSRRECRIGEKCNNNNNIIFKRSTDRVAQQQP